MRKFMIALAALALMLVPGLAYAQEPPSSVAQICLATDVEAVDAVLAAAAETELVGALAPLVTLTVPSEPEGVQLDADVTLAEVRDALGCVDGPATTTHMPTETPEPTETATPEPTTPSTSAPSDDDSDDGQVTRVPRGGVDTGDGSSLK